MPAQPAIGVLGAGAVGCYFGGMLARAGLSVHLVGRATHMEAVAANGLHMTTTGFDEFVPVASADQSPRMLSQCDVILFAVKTTDNVSAAQTLSEVARPDAIIISMQNGVDNVERLAPILSMPVIPAAVYVAAAMVGLGHIQHNGRGDLVIGSDRAESPGRDMFASIAAMFERAGVPCRVSQNITGELWAKLATNCAYNAISALARARYGAIAHSPGARQLIADSVEELLAVAHAMGITLPNPDPVASVLQLADSMPLTTSSMAQDLVRGRRTENASLNGFIAAKGEALGVPTPVNRTLAALIALAESGSAVA